MTTFGAPFSLLRPICKLVGNGKVLHRSKERLLAEIVDCLAGDTGLEGHCQGDGTADEGARLEPREMGVPRLEPGNEGKRNCKSMERTLPCSMKTPDILIASGKNGRIEV